MFDIKNVFDHDAIWLKFNWLNMRFNLWKWLRILKSKRSFGRSYAICKQRICRWNNFIFKTNFLVVSKEIDHIVNSRFNLQKFLQEYSFQNFVPPVTKNSAKSNKLQFKFRIISDFFAKKPPLSLKLHPYTKPRILLLASFCLRELVTQRVSVVWPAPHLFDLVNMRMSSFFFYFMLYKWLIVNSWLNLQKLL